MIPLYDEAAPSIKPPYITIALITLNVFIFIITFGNLEGMILKYGFVPAQFLKGENLITLLSSMFLHAGILHLIVNMWFFWLFGDNVEYNLGPVRFIIFYLLVGMIASIFHAIFSPAEHFNIPAVGASGAISGLLGGYLILFPRNKIRAFMFLYFRPYIFSVPAYTYIAIWFVYQLLYIGEPTSVAYLAHLGGFLGGVILIFLMRRKIIRKDYL